MWVWVWVGVGGCVPLFLPVHANDGHAPPPPPPLSRSQSNCLAGLYSFLSRLIKPHLSSGRPVAVIIDDLSVLLGQGVGLGEVVDFVHYCQVLVCHSSEESGVSVCVLCVCVCACVRVCVCVCVCALCVCICDFCNCWSIVLCVGVPVHHGAR